MATLRRVGTSELGWLTSEMNLANCLFDLGRTAESLRMRRQVFADTTRLYGIYDEDTIYAADHLSESLIDAKFFKEVKALLRKHIPAARRTLGENHEITLEQRFA